MEIFNKFVYIEIEPAQHWMFVTIEHNLDGTKSDYDILMGFTISFNA